MNDLSQLEKKLQLKFSDKQLLFRAFTHRSYLNEKKGKGLNSNERLEFLGDAVLELWVSQIIFNRFPDYPEGNLTNLRSQAVCTKTLASVARKLALYRYLRLSRGEKKESGGKNDSLMADTFEALVGAIYHDQGMAACGKFLQKYILPQIKRIAKKPTLKDYKSLLQEKIQESHGVTPRYRLLKEFGPDHDKTFIFAVMAENEKLAQGEGKSKQAAQQEAAKKALNVFAPQQ